MFICSWGILEILAIPTVDVVVDTSPEPARSCRSRHSRQRVHVASGLTVSCGQGYLGDNLYRSFEYMGKSNKSLCHQRLSPYWTYIVPCVVPKAYSAATRRALITSYSLSLRDRVPKASYVSFWQSRSARECSSVDCSVNGLHYLFLVRLANRRERICPRT